MEYAFINVQCQTNLGETGTFLTEKAGKDDRVAISPVFDGLMGLYQWMRQNNWETRSYDEYQGEHGYGNYTWNRVAKI